MRFAFVAKHRRIWPVSWLYYALDAARSGSHPWLGRAPSTRSRELARADPGARCICGAFAVSVLPSWHTSHILRRMDSTAKDGADN